MNGEDICVLMDDFGRIGTAVCRALHNADRYRLHAVVPRRDALSSVRERFKSNSINTVTWLPNAFDRRHFAKDMTAAAMHHHADLILPAGHVATITLALVRDQLAKVCPVAVDNYEKILTFHDKRQCQQLARTAGVPHPKTIVPRSLEEATEFAARTEYPVVLKARKGTGADGTWYADNHAQLTHLWESVTEKHHAGDAVIRDVSGPMLQEYVPGELHDVVAFCIEGEIRCALTQRRVVTKPRSGGMGIVNITTDEPRLRSYAAQLVSRTGFTGVLLFDFMIDSRDQIPKLLEVNPRFWGTTWLTICAGLNFPDYLVRTSLGQPVDFPQKYRTDLMCRWFMLEINTLFERPVNPDILQRFMMFLRRFGHSPCVSDIVLRDLKPTVADVLGSLRGLATVGQRSMR